MKNTIKLLDVVALTADLPEYNLWCGQVGTVVEILAHGNATMKIPNADRAVVDIRKLRDYCLNPRHRMGKHKARMFAAALSMTADDAEALRDILLKAMREYEPN